MDLGNIDLEALNKLVLTMKGLGVQRFQLGELVVYFPDKPNADPDYGDFEIPVLPENDDKPNSKVDWVADGIRV